MITHRATTLTYLTHIFSLSIYIIYLKTISQKEIDNLIKKYMPKELLVTKFIFIFFLPITKFITLRYPDFFLRGMVQPNFIKVHTPNIKPCKYFF